MERWSGGVRMLKQECAEVRDKAVSILDPINEAGGRFSVTNPVSSLRT